MISTARILVLGPLFAIAAVDAASAQSVVIRRARVADGTGGALRMADVRIENGRIVAVGEIARRRGEITIEGRGKVLAPGFIDVHNHSTSGLAREPLAISQISQGITTLLVGQDGSSPLPVAEYLDARRNAPGAVNVATCVGHASVRSRVMGEDYKRAARPDEVARMEALVDQGFKDGALCLSSGLEYEVGGYAATE